MSAEVAEIYSAWLAKRAQGDDPPIPTERWQKDSPSDANVHGYDLYDDPNDEYWSQFDKVESLSKADRTIARSLVVLEKFNPYHRGPGGPRGGEFTTRAAAATTGGEPNVTITGPPKRKKTLAQRQKEYDALTAPQRKLYDSLPESATHEEAMAALKAGKGLRKKDGYHEPTQHERDTLKKPGTNQKLIPPAWTHVLVANDLKHPPNGLLANGLDTAGRMQPAYSVEHNKAAAQSKYTRVVAFDRQMNKLDKAIAENIGKGNAAADCLALIRKLGLRPDTEAKTHAQQEAFGATTLQARHFTIRANGTIHLDFIGKKGVRIILDFKDDAIKNMLIKRLRNKSGKDRVFDTDSDKVTAFMREHVPKQFKLKDLRTHVATTTAADIIKHMTPPENEAQFKRMRNEVADQISARLGNTRIEVLRSYINPKVFADWEAGIA